MRTIEAIKTNKRATECKRNDKSLLAKRRTRNKCFLFVVVFFFLRKKSRLKKKNASVRALSHTDKNMYNLIVL